MPTRRPQSWTNSLRGLGASWVGLCSKAPENSRCDASVTVPWFTSRFVGDTVRQAVRGCSNYKIDIVSSVLYYTHMDTHIPSMAAWSRIRW
jgi:hypothetical protein